jgi:hypothetical protein
MPNLIGIFVSFLNKYFEQCVKQKLKVLNKYFNSAYEPNGSKAKNVAN